MVAGIFRIFSCFWLCRLLALGVVDAYFAVPDHCVCEGNGYHVIFNSI